jgi:hypothetical protein
MILIKINKYLLNFKNKPIHNTIIATRPKIVKRKLTISANDILFTTPNEYKLQTLSAYTFLDNLSKYFDLFLIILIKDEDDEVKIVDEFSEIIKDNIILKHVSSVFL